MLDDLNLLKDADKSGFLARLAALPGSYAGPDGLREEPYGLLAFGEAAGLARALQSWVDAPLVVSGTQFLLASGFDYGELAPLKLSSQMTDAEVVVLGSAAYEPNLHVPQDVLSPYTYASYLAYATGHAEALEQAEAAMASLSEQVAPEVATEQNPAKALAWALWNRVPLLLAGRGSQGPVGLLQRVWARVGKTLAITVGEHPLEILSGAFEARHQLADDLVVLIIGLEDEETRLAEEVLKTRAAQIEHLGLPFAGAGQDVEDAGTRSLVLWYVGLWVAAYLALLNQQSPEDSPVYLEVRKAAQG
jgi:hypothetical protein